MRACHASAQLHCPLEARINPHVEAVSEASLAWAVRRGVLTSEGQRRAYAEARFGHAIARAFPGASRACLRLATDWLILSTLIDDVVETWPEARARRAWLGQLSASLRDPSGSVAGDDPFALAMAELGLRLAAMASPAVISAFTAEVERLFEAFVTEAELDGATLSVARYCALRECTITMATYYALAPLLDDFTLRPGDRRDPQVEALMARASMVIAVVNDLSSYARELADGNPFNLVAVLIRSRGLSLDEAVEELISTHNRELSSLLAELDALAAADRGRGARTRIAAMLRRCVTGHFAWVLESGRYEF